MKFLVLVLSFLGFLSMATAHQGGTEPQSGPIVPWPTSYDRSEMYIEALQGEWIAYTDDEVWFVTIQSDDNDYRIKLTIITDAFRNAPVDGLGYWGKHLYWGHVALDGVHYSGMVLYYDQSGLRLRVGQAESFREFRLERAPWN